MSEQTVQALGEEQTPGHEGQPTGGGTARGQRDGTRLRRAAAGVDSLRRSRTGRSTSRVRGAGSAAGRGAAATDDADGTPDGLRAELERVVEPARVLTRPIELVMYASDASPYRMVPQAVVLTKTVEEVTDLFALSRRTGVPMTFRAAGTSLSGQAQSDGILVEVARHWRGVQAEGDGARVRVGPGTIAARVNLALKPYGRKLGPDPASIAACTVGGIVANNSSGMCCGVQDNAYHTLSSLTFALPSGTVIDTAAPDAAERFEEQEPELAAGLLRLRQTVLADHDLTARIRTKYARKNTTGYGLNSLLDFDEPLEIFRHLLVGSEGTLAFVAEAVFDTVPTLPHRVTGLLVFPDVHTAGAAVVPLREVGATAVELMDRASLRAVERQAGVPAYLPDLPDGAAALLVDVATADEAELPGLEAAAAELVAGLDLVVPGEFTRDAALQAQFWAVRGGLFTSVGAARPSGTSVVLEDVTFPVERLADAVVDLTRLFAAHGYAEAVVFGHAKDGNLHFLLTPSLNADAEVERYAAFMDALADLVVGAYDGALKGEHGTGRNIAPFVEQEWGPTAYAVMRELKRLVDPDGLLNPGTIVNDDPRAHLQHLKTVPTIESSADRCIECGYCEPVCPSRELTTTPRQRIVIRREMVRQGQAAADGVMSPRDVETPVLRELRRDYAYMGLDTCAGDGMCERACPVDINTGDLVKGFRADRHGERSQQAAVTVAQRYATVERVARLALRSGRTTASLVGHRTVTGMTELLRAATSTDLVPRWDPSMPPPAPGRLPRTSPAGAQAVYLPACINRIFGPDGATDGPTLPEALVALARRAQVPVVIPDDVAGTCCGTPWQSKGYAEGAATVLRTTVDRLWRASDGGRLPVVVDASSCTLGLREAEDALGPDSRERWRALTVLDSLEFVHDRLLPRLVVDTKVDAVAVHAVCSVHHLGTVGTLEALAGAVAERVVNPPEAGCCGFAGDRGWLHPELPASALADEAAALAGQELADHLCSNRTCEVGLSREIGAPYRSVVHALEEATRGMELPSAV